MALRVSPHIHKKQRSGVSYPYRTVICGEEHIVNGWQDGNLITDKGQYVLQRLQGEDVKSEWAGDIIKVPEYCQLSKTTILEIATFGLGEDGDFLLNGFKLETLRNLPFGWRLDSVAQSETLRVRKREIRAVVWVEAVSSGSKTIQLDSVLSDWKTQKLGQSISQYSLLNNLSIQLFLGWSKPVWLKEFYPADKKPLEAVEAITNVVELNSAKPPAEFARFENDFNIAAIPGQDGQVSRFTIEQELRNLIKEIVDYGGHKPRTELRKGKPESWQPEKLFNSETAKLLIKAGLLGKRKSGGRTVIYWAIQKIS